MGNNTKSIMVVTGEASGDNHGAHLVQEIKRIDPNVSFYGMGGEELEKENVEMVFDARKVAVMGIAEVFSHLKDIRDALKTLTNVIKKRKPDLLILVDFGDFNLRLAKKAKKIGIPIFYYITPKVWVWRKKRVKKIARYVDQAGVILPFEESYLRRHGVKAKYVGNPTLDSLKVSFGREDFCKRHSLEQKKKIIGILPGSRKSEVGFLLPIFLETASKLQLESKEELQFVIPIASTLKEEDLKSSGLLDHQDTLNLKIIRDDRYELMAACDCVMAASGTVTLELAILNTPMVVAYKFAPLTYLIGKILINIPFFSLVNIIAEKEVVKEFLQHEVTVESLQDELKELLYNEAKKKKLMEDFKEVRITLGEKGCATRGAQLALDTMNRFS